MAEMGNPSGRAFAAFRGCAAALSLTVIVVSSAMAQTSAPELRVAVGIVPPFVMEQNGALTGFSIELWNAVAGQLNVKTNYQMMPDAHSLEEAMQSKNADVGATPVVITSARDEKFDFSLPMLYTGLQVMVRETGETVKPTNPLWDLLRLLVSRTTAVWLGIAVLLILIPAHLVWLFERRHKDGIVSSENYFPGILDALFWAVATLTAQAEMMPRQWMARLLSVYWMFAGVVFVAFYTAQLTTTLTVEKIRGVIEGPEDLPGKQVGTIARSPAADYLREQNAQVQEFQRTDQMFKALLDKKVDAVVFTAPVLLYYAAHEGKGLVRIAGPEFYTSPVAFVVQLNSPLRKRIDRALLRLRENGTYQQIYNKWFGGP